MCCFLQVTGSEAQKVQFVMSRAVTSEFKWPGTRVVMKCRLIHHWPCTFKLAWWFYYPILEKCGRSSGSGATKTRNLFLLLLFFYTTNVMSWWLHEQKYALSYFENKFHKINIFVRFWVSQNVSFVTWAWLAHWSPFFVMRKNCEMVSILTVFRLFKPKKPFLLHPKMMCRS